MSQNKPKPNPNLFVKGDQRAIEGGKKSRRNLPADLKAARAQYSNDLEACIYKYSEHTKDEMLRALKHPDTPALDLVVLNILTKAITKGDQQRLGFLLDRTIGKVKERIITENLNVNADIQVTKEDVRERIKQLKGEDE